MNNPNIKPIVSFLVTDLVQHGVIGEKRSDTEWVLEADFAGMPATTVFRSRDELIARVTAYYIDALERANVLRVAS